MSPSDLNIIKSIHPLGTLQIHLPNHSRRCTHPRLPALPSAAIVEVTELHAARRAATQQATARRSASQPESSCGHGQNRRFFSYEVEQHDEQHDQLGRPFREDPTSRNGAFEAAGVAKGTSCWCLEDADVRTHGDGSFRWK